MILTLLFLLLFPGNDQLQLHCTVTSTDPIVLQCADEQGNDLRPFRAPRGLKLNQQHLNAGLSTVVLERQLIRSRHTGAYWRWCVVQVQVMGGWTNEPVNQKYGCVKGSWNSPRRR